MNSIQGLSSGSAPAVPATNDSQQGSSTPRMRGPILTPSPTGSPFVAASAASQRAYTKARPATSVAGTNTSAPSNEKPPLVPLSPQDQQTFDARQAKLAHYDAPDARKLAKDFIQQTLHVDGDQYIVAHFKDDREGKPDTTYTLTEAVMQNFPGFRHRGNVPHLSDEVGFYSTGGVSLEDEAKSMLHSKSAADFFTHVGKSIWNRTGPGYVYNLINNDNPSTESSRRVDQAFGIYKKADHGEQTYTQKNRFAFKPSQVYDRFKAGEVTEVPYITKLNGELNAYWNKVKSDWPSVKRYQFLEDARNALQNGSLTIDEYKMVMKGAAPQLALKPPYALKDLDRASPPDPSVKVARFDIYGYPATDILRFIGRDHHEVMYIPGNEPPFVVTHSSKERAGWVIEQAKDRQKKAQLESHFSIYDRQDGTFYSGVDNALKGLGDGTWSPDDGHVNKDNQIIDGDVFQDMAQHVEKRLRDDSSMQTRTAAEAWMDTLNMWSVFLVAGPGKSMRMALATGKAAQVGIQVGTGVAKTINGKTTGEREGGALQVGVAAGVGAM